MIETITVREAAELLKYKKIKSVETWCKKNNLPILSENGNKKKYLIRAQFEYARLKKFILYLKEKYKEKWLVVFEVYMSMNLTRVVEMEEAGTTNYNIMVTDYKPKGEFEKSFLAHLTGKLTEL